MDVKAFISTLNLTLSLKPQTFFCMPGILQVCCGVYNCAFECMWAECVHINAAGRWMESVWEVDVGNRSCQSVSGQMESNLEQQLDVSNSIFEISHLSCTFLRDRILTQTYFCRFCDQSASFEQKEERDISQKWLLKPQMMLQEKVVQCVTDAKEYMRFVWLLQLRQLLWHHFHNVMR